MLTSTIVATVILLIIGIVVPFLSNIKTPKNLHDWYFGNQALTLWIVIGVGIIAIWMVYIFM